MNKIKMFGFQEGLISLLPKHKEKKYILIEYRNKAIGLYTPKRNIRKLAMLGLLFIPFLVTPFTNWVYMLGLNILFKINPLWVYR